MSRGSKLKSGSVVVITGSSAGVGRATAVAFARKGAKVALFARDENRLREAKREVEEAGAEKVIAVSGDVANFDDVDRLAQHAEEQLGPIDIWVNNTMTAVFARFLDTKPDEFRRVTDVTYHGHVHGTLAALRRMIPRDSGTIIQIGSALAYRGIPLQASYCGAKHAIQGFTESVRCELLNQKSKVEVGSVHLPAMNTPQFDWVLSRLPKKPQPVPPIYQPEVAAEAVVAMAERPRREMWVGEPTVLTIAANKFIPGLLDRYLGRNGVDSQQRDEPDNANRPHNLWEPVPGSFGTHGSFGDIAHESSPVTWASRHKRTFLSGLGATAVAAAVGHLRAHRR